MSDAKGSQEPSMEEILASIRRIISEDSGPPAATPAAEPMPTAFPADDVLELTEPADDEPVTATAPLMAPPLPAPIVSRMPDAEPLPAPAAPPMPAASRLISDSAAAASSAALAAISEKARRRPGPETAVGTPGVTLEDIARDLLRPLLRDWLDANLPAIVERLVAEEIRRLGHEAGSSRH